MIFRSEFFLQIMVHQLQCICHSCMSCDLCAICVRHVTFRYESHDTRWWPPDNRSTYSKGGAVDQQGEGGEVSATASRLMRGNVDKLAAIANPRTAFFTISLPRHTQSTVIGQHLQLYNGPRKISWMMYCTVHMHCMYWTHTCTCTVIHVLAISHMP